MKRNFKEELFLKGKKAYGLTKLLTCTEEGREVFKNPALRDFIKNYNGLLKGTIISNFLYLPPTENSTECGFLKASAGEWVSYDPTRKQILNQKYLETEHGRLFVYDIPEVRHHTKDEYTPLNSIRMFDAQHAYFFIPRTSEELINGKFIEETTYQKALENLGNTDPNILKELKESRRENTIVYQVTPKGNGLIVLDHGVGNNEDESFDFSAEFEKDSDFGFQV